MSTETQVETSTEVESETETETGTVTRTEGACAIGAGAAAITCKAMVLGFLAGGLALVGLSAVNPAWLMLVALVGIVGYTLYERALAETALALFGGVVTFYLDGSMYGFPAKGGILGMLGVTIGDAPAGDVISAAITWGGLGIMFLALFRAFYPEMEMLPSDWPGNVTPSNSSS